MFLFCAMGESIWFNFVVIIQLRVGAMVVEEYIKEIGPKYPTGKLL